MLKLTLSGDCKANKQKADKQLSNRQGHLITVMTEAGRVHNAPLVASLQDMLQSYACLATEVSQAGAATVSPCLFFQLNSRACRRW